MCVLGSACFCVFVWTLWAFWQWSHMETSYIIRELTQTPFSPWAACRSSHKTHTFHISTNIGAHPHARREKKNTMTQVFLLKYVPEPRASIFICTLAQQNMTCETDGQKDYGLVVRQRRGKEDVFSLHSSLHGEKRGPGQLTTEQRACWVISKKSKLAFPLSEQIHASS